MLITDKALAKLPYAASGQYKVNDTEKNAQRLSPPREPVGAMG
ncbi:hypothetical protein [Mesorhizobium sp. CN2-181]